MDKLPDEMLSQILQLLSPMDRLNSALTCLRWAEIVSTPPMLEDSRLYIPGFEMNRAAAVLLGSRRSYTSLKIVEANLSDHHIEFWTKIGANLRELELEKCSWAPEVFYAILRQCSRLETLKLDDPDRRIVYGKAFKLPEGCRPEEICLSLSHLQNLHLHMNVTNQLLTRLLRLMPNVTTLYLSKFNWKSGLWPLSAISSRMNLNVDFTEIYVRDDKLINFLKTYSGNLQQLKLNYGLCNIRDAFAAISTCNKLRHLTLQYTRNLGDHHLKAILANVPDLETLVIDDCEALTDEAFVDIYKLENLRRFTLWLNRHVTSEFLCSLGSISTLQHLELGRTAVNARVLRSITCLKHLKSLHIDTDSFDSECLEIICENFKTLRELHFGNSENLTAADGAKLRHLKELRSLRFYFAFGFTDLTFEKGLGPPTLRSLRMDQCRNLTDTGLASIASHHGRLKTFEISGCHKITDAGLEALLERETLLEDLEVRVCHSLGRGWLNALEKLCPRLRTVVIKGCKVGDAAKKQFMASRPSIRITNENDISE